MAEVRDDERPLLGEVAEIDLLPLSVEDGQVGQLSGHRSKVLSPGESGE